MLEAFCLAALTMQPNARSEACYLSLAVITDENWTVQAW